MAALAEGEVALPHLFVVVDGDTWAQRSAGGSSSLFTNKPWVGRIVKRIFQL